MPISKIISEIIKNKSIPKEVNSIAINDMHLSKSISKSLRNFLYVTNEIGNHDEEETKSEKEKETEKETSS